MKIRFLLLLTLLLISSVTMAQSNLLSGRVIDSKGEALIGVNVTLKGSTLGTITGANGTFSINAQSGSTLVLSFIGYTTQEIKVTNSTTHLTITMQADVQTL